MAAVGKAPFTFVDLFAGIGGFHAVLAHAGGQCTLVSEINQPALQTYCANWVDGLPRSLQPQIVGDIEQVAPEQGAVLVPPHDVLAAGFPCQPFSKSGFQRGMDESRGTLFWNIARVLQERRPALVILENVRNLAGPRHRHTWEVIIRTLRDLGYRVSDVPEVCSPHRIPPHMGGSPQVRDRVFIVGIQVGRKAAWEAANQRPLLGKPLVPGWDPQRWRAEDILLPETSLPEEHKYALSAAETEWLSAWDAFIRAHRKATGKALPGFPLWSDVWRGSAPLTADLDAMPTWKARFMRNNWQFFVANRAVIEKWQQEYPQVVDFPLSRRKLEWQAQDTPSLWEGIIQLRPSGVRVKAATYFPALVAITQTSIVGARRRRLSPAEAARLQGLPADFRFANAREADSYRQVGNGVAVGAAWHVLHRYVSEDNARPHPDLPWRLRTAVLGAGSANLSGLS